VLSLPHVNPDVLMAPHHGSKAANTDELRDWASPKLVVSCEGIPRTLSRKNAYTRKSIPYWTTHEHGAITLHSHRTGLVAESYRSEERLVMKRGSGGGESVTSNQQSIVSRGARSTATASLGLGHPFRVRKRGVFTPKGWSRPQCHLF
jgi:hypothetical protein